ncbi:MAG: FliG C-terminal domain-containing protein [Pseudomonadota bacterium]
MSSELERMMQEFNSGNKDADRASPGPAGDGEFLSKSSGFNDGKSISYDQKASIILYVLGPVKAAAIFEKLDDKDHRAFAKALHKIGFVEAEHIEVVMKEYLGALRNDGPIRGGSNEARRFLASMLPKDMVEQIMEEVDGRFDANIWDRVSLAPEMSLAQYLKGEQMQTVAVILSRIKPEKAAKVLDMFPEEKAKGIILQMARIGSIDRSILEDVQHALRYDFLATLMKQSSTRKPSDIIASVLNNIPGTKQQEFLDDLREQDESTAEVVQRSMFTFDDFTKRIDPLSLQKIIKEVNADDLVKGLKMAEQRQPDVYDYFLGNMSKRAAESMREEIESFGALRMKDAEMAQQEIIRITRELAKAGQIEIMEVQDDNAESQTGML